MVNITFFEGFCVQRNLGGSMLVGIRELGNSRMEVKISSEFRVSFAWNDYGSGSNCRWKRERCLLLNVLRGSFF